MKAATGYQVNKYEAFQTESFAASDRFLQEIDRLRLAMSRLMLRDRTSEWPATINA